ncbi:MULTISPECIES: hypothetical protein [Trichocoleus]|uniref:Uncharacterized protein n=1 Tax=Trichocoleus desertorum GB2-A4 TaxID=2933944 RepID=A0ABV0JF18_9CYAN|nr:hypothetical protein [Trichocoleus sp. FACHB-46]MBD1864294.1 hypothetical protein [Trichocoleus sp. FACHB-46]
MSKQHPLDNSGTYYAENLELLHVLQSLDWEWLEDPHQYPFLRLIKGKGNKKSVSAGALDKTKQSQIVVGVGRRDGQSLVLAYRKLTDFTCDAYRKFPQDPIGKPIEAVDTRVLTGVITPEVSWNAIMSSLPEYMRQRTNSLGDQLTTSDSGADVLASKDFDPENPEQFWRGNYNFYCDQHTQNLGGKAYSPNSLNVRISSRLQAWRMLNQLVRYLEEADNGQEQVLDLMFFGSLELMEEDSSHD